ncbi:MAG: DUF2062 domain-containing protein [Pseudomonadota bacterium]
MIKKIGLLLWPSGGWRRQAAYLGHRLRRLPGTPTKIAMGFACGAAVSFTPFVGLHFIMAAALAYPMRANIIASAVGTAVGNPWTFPFIWILIYRTGAWMMGVDHATALPDDISLAYLWDHLWDVFVPAVVGGVPWAIVAWFLAFFPVKLLVEKYQRNRRNKMRRLARQHRMKARLEVGEGKGTDAKVSSKPTAPVQEAPVGSVSVTAGHQTPQK